MVLLVTPNINRENVTIICLLLCLGGGGGQYGNPPN